MPNIDAHHTALIYRLCLRVGCASLTTFFRTHLYLLYFLRLDSASTVLTGASPRDINWDLNNSLLYFGGKSIQLKPCRTDHDNVSPDLASALLIITKQTQLAQQQLKRQAQLFKASLTPADLLNYPCPQLSMTE